MRPRADRYALLDDVEIDGTRLLVRNEMSELTEVTYSNRVI
jgi:hypothetical protein